MRVSIERLPLSSFLEAGEDGAMCTSIGLPSVPTVRATMHRSLLRNVFANSGSTVWTSMGGVTPSPMWYLPSASGLGRGWWGFAGALVCLSPSATGLGVACGGNADSGAARVVAGMIQLPINAATQNLIKADIGIFGVRKRLA